MAKRQSDQKEFIAALAKSPPAPVYLFSGEEELLIDEAVDQVIERSLTAETRPFNLDLLYGGDASGPQIAALAAALPMMGERRVVVVWEADRLPAKDSLIPYFDHPSSSTSLVLVATRPDFRQKFFKALSERAVAFEFARPYDNDLPSWITARVNKLGKQIGAEAVLLLQSHVGRSLRELQNEIDKLLIYVGVKPEISTEDVSVVVGVSKQFNIFELQSAVGKMEFPRAQEILERMLTAGESAPGIVAMLAKYLQKLWLIQELVEKGAGKQEIAAALRISPKQAYFLDADIVAAKRSSAEKLESSFRHLIEADEKLKSSQGSDRVVMTLLMYSLCSPAVEQGGAS